MKVPKMYQQGRGEGTTAPAAISRAFKDMLKKVKGKRVSIINAKIILTTKEQEPSLPKEAPKHTTGIDWSIT
jgi:hypothetical protein